MDSAACYRVLQARDARFDGHFFTGVHSTGIYCRPVCKVRIPMGKNAFFALPTQVDAAGFRPYLRCRPELAPQRPRFTVGQCRTLGPHWCARRFNC
jgi:AraC family transcriptional regulator of adaptative response / DNA-3-methyladenine glycosylase II